jgi:excisionase family DNA binding protein
MDTVGTKWTGAAMSNAKKEATAGNDSPRMTVSVEHAAAVLGISRGAGYAAARNGELPTIRIGKRLLVPKAALERLLAGV